MFNLALAASHAATIHPSRTAVVTPDGSLTFAELDAQISRAARGLQSAGMRPGDTVALHLPTSAAFVICFYAALRAGLIAAPVAPYAAPRELRHALEISASQALITASADPPEGCDGVPVMDCETLVARGADGRSDPFVARSPEDVAAVIFTSGTTGAAKAAKLTHWNLWMSCTALSARTSPTSEDVVLACLPLHHVFGMSGLMNASLAWGMTLVLRPRFDAAEALDLIAKHRVTRFSGVPTMFMDMIREGAQGRDLSSLRHVTSGGAALPPGVLEDFEEMIPSATLLEGYGASETTSSICVNSSRERRRLGSVGTPSWGTRVRVVAEDGALLPAGPEHIGELQVSGPTVFAGYADDPEATAAAFDGEWLRTGDVAWIDADQYVHLVDRRSSLIIRGGLNVYPAEVEQVLSQHTAVQEAVVLGQPHERLGEEIAALIVPGRPLGELTGEHRAQLVEHLDHHAREHLAAYKRPRLIRFVDSLPRTPSGKILRPAARDLLAEQLSDVD
ncbi:class I adenylate-forming enzyme family protein [Nesterenkonia xinjiangensis]|uniref:Long-chain acyl-CoA synthetase n=1 Tax=Nesterenkonia xinjiangensis TaxID=225327 RepID=A0A7Z0KA48_9MICC|nr:AMP-binding protein [Nesterenkonia xinjiangensis]NYJ77915.1 long-chain acyl-CoA synthetase [Nesterenkonia xinjiangensis]